MSAADSDWPHGFDRPLQSAPIVRQTDRKSEGECDIISPHRRKEAAMAERKKLKVYLESSFVSYLTGRETDDAKIAADQAHTRRWMREQAPQTFLENLTLGKRK